MKRRNAQVDLLVEACRTHQPVRIDQEREGAGERLDGAFLSCDERGVIVEVADCLDRDAMGNAPKRVRAHFGVRGRRYSFLAPLQNTVALPARENRRRIGLKLGLPLVVCERSHRRSERLCCPNDVSIAVRLASVDRPLALEGRLFDLSEGGIAVDVSHDLVGHFAIDQIFRAQIVPPDRSMHCACLVRVVHVQAAGEHARVGMSFVGRDDSTEFDSFIRKLQDWIVDALRRASLRAAVDDGGTR